MIGISGVNRKNRLKVLVPIALVIFIAAIIALVKGCGNNDDSHLGEDLIIKDFEPEEDQITLELLGEKYVTVNLENGEEYVEAGIDVINRDTGFSYSKIVEKVMSKVEIRSILPRGEEVPMQQPYLEVLKNPGFYKIIYRYNDKLVERLVYVIGTAEAEDNEEGEGATNEVPSQLSDAKSDVKSDVKSETKTETPNAEITETPSAGGDSNNESTSGGGNSGGSDGGGNSDDKPKPKPFYDMSGVSLPDRTYVYDGTEKHLYLEGNLPEGVRWWSENNGQVEVGTYTVTFHFEGSKSYQPIPDMTAKLTITKAYYDMSSVKVSGLSVTYDGQKHYVFDKDVTGLPQGVNLDWVEGDGQSEPGIHDIILYFKGDEKNYWPIEPIKLKMIISDKPEQEGMDAIRVSGWLVKYDGNVHHISVDNLPENVELEKIEGDGQSLPGVYDITLYFKGDDLHKPVSPVTIQMVILEFQDETVTYNGGDWSLEVENTFGFKLDYFGNKVSEAGSHEIKATCSRGGIYEEGSITATLTIVKNTSTPGEDKEDPDETDPDNPNGGDPEEDKDNPDTSNPDNPSGGDPEEDKDNPDASEPDSSEPGEDKDDPSTSEPDSSEPGEDKDNPDASEPDSSEPGEDKDGPSTSEPDKSDPEEDKDSPDTSEPDSSDPGEDKDGPSTSEPDKSDPEEDKDSPDTSEPDSSDPIEDDLAQDDANKVEEATGNAVDEESTEQSEEQQVVETQPVEDVETQTEEATEVVEGSDSDETSSSNEDEQQILEAVVPESMDQTADASKDTDDTGEKTEEIDSKSDDKESD